MEGGYLSNFQNPSLDILGYLFENSFLSLQDAGKKIKRLNKVKLKIGYALLLKMYCFSIQWTGA